VGLPSRCIRLTGKTEAVVLDPFMGTGTTLVAAHRLGHKGIGIEMDATYAAMAEKRILAEIQKELSND
jgi:site-specific DNA-methyltransferase (adenine-specific)